MLHSFADLPAKLSAWGLFNLNSTTFSLSEAIEPYSVNMPLFSDYTLKLRTLWIPPGTQIRQVDAQFDYPVGTILSKTFYYPKHGDQLQLQPNDAWQPPVRNLSLLDHQLIETRLFVRESQGWEGVSYIWDGADANLALTGDLLPLELQQQTTAVDVDFAYHVPSRNECRGCHAVNHSSGLLQPLGAIPAQLVGQANQDALSRWQQRGWLSHAPTVAHPFAVWNTAAPSTAQARAYLDANCSHCHNPQGAADTSALDLTRTNAEPRSLGLCKPPIAAGKGTGGLLYAVVPGAADQSILLHRLRSTDLGSRMPEIGRALTHTQGVSLVASWIDSLTGVCR